LSESDLRQAVGAQERFLGHVLRAQLADLAAGRPASNKVPLPVVQGESSRAQLKADLRHAALLQELARDQIAR
jgi:hypothetical protein